MGSTIASESEIARRSEARWKRWNDCVEKYHFMTLLGLYWMILLKQYRGGQAMAVRELMIIMLIINTIPCVSVSYARRLMRLVLMLMGQGKCSLLIDGNSVYTNGSRRGVDNRRRLLDISSSLPPPPTLPPSFQPYQFVFFAFFWPFKVFITSWGAADLFFGTLSKRSDTRWKANEQTSLLQSLNLDKPFLNFKTVSMTWATSLSRKESYFNPTVSMAIDLTKS